MIHYTYIIYYIYIYDIYFIDTDTHPHVMPHFQYDCSMCLQFAGRWNDWPGDSSGSQSRAKAGIPWYLDGSSRVVVEFPGFPSKKAGSMVGGFLGIWWLYIYIYLLYIYISPTTNLREPETAIEWVLVKEDVFFFQGRKAYVQSKVTFESMSFLFPFGGICYSS